MSVFKIPVNWEVYGIMCVEADDIEKAIELAIESTPYPAIEDNIDGSLGVNFELIELLNPRVKIKDEPNTFMNSLLNIKCPKCGEFLYRTETDGMWCRRKCFASEYDVWKAVEESMTKKD